MKLKSPKNARTQKLYTFSPFFDQQRLSIDRYQKLTIDVRDMTTHIRIGKDAKSRLERLADIEGITEKEAIARAITFFEIAVLRRHLSQKGIELTPQQLQKVKEIQAWLARQGKRKFKQLTRKGD